MLTFDEATHRYWWDGKPVPNVTRILDFFCHSYDHVPRDVLERARQEGSAIHKAVELHIKGTLDYCPAWLDPYLLAWEAFVHDTGFELEFSEMRVWYPIKNEQTGQMEPYYCGTADLVGWMDYPKLGRRHVLPDIKRSFCAGPAIGLQTAAYAAAYNAGIGNVEGVWERIQQRFALRFRPGMSPPYQIEHFNEPSDFAAWSGMLNTYRWLEQNGKL